VIGEVLDQEPGCAISEKSWRQSPITLVPLSAIFRGHEKSIGSVWGTPYIMTCWTQVVGFLNDKEEMNSLAALKRLDVGRLNEVIILFLWFVKSEEGNSVSYFNVFPMLQKQMSNP
jgi:hypothetical protein